MRARLSSSLEIVDEIELEGRQIRVVWRPAEFEPPLDLITQASGVCFTEEGKVVLVSKDGINWQLPGGHLDAGETPQAAFVREVAEEACAEVLQMRYLGAQEVHDPGDPEGRVYYQTRFWARVRLKDFYPAFEIVERRCFDFDEVKTALNWQTKNVLDEIIRRCEECNLLE